LLKSVTAAVVFTAAGALCSAVVLSFGPPETRGEGWAEFPFCAGAAAFMTSLTVWWLHVARTDKPGTMRGAAAGLAIGVLAHPVTWYVLICWNWMLAGLSLRHPSAAGDPLNPVTGVLGALVFSVWSIVIVGWITVPAGALVGTLVARLQGMLDAGLRRR
jgi:hypothetical protein